MLPQDWNLPSATREHFSASRAGRQRAFVDDGHLLIALHKIPHEGENYRTPVYFWRKPTGEWFSHPEAGGISALGDHLETYALHEDELEEEVKLATNARQHLTILNDTIIVWHATKNMHITLNQARQLLPEDEKILEFRDWAYAIERNYELLEANARNALDIYQAEQAEEANRISRQLNILAAIFFPLTALASIFGMELDSGIPQDIAFYFWIIVVVGLVMGVTFYGWLRGKDSN